MAEFVKHNSRIFCVVCLWREPAKIHSRICGFLTWLAQPNIGPRARRRIEADLDIWLVRRVVKNKSDPRILGPLFGMFCNFSLHHRITFQEMNCEAPFAP